MERRQWETLGADRERRRPSQDFTLTVRVLDRLVEECLELFPSSLRCLFGREEQVCLNVGCQGKKNLLSQVFEPYSVRSSEYMITASWAAREAQAQQETCLYQMMCEETPTGQILFRIYEFLKRAECPLRMLGGAVVYARCSEESPDVIRYRYRLHDRKGSYTLPAMRLCTDTKEELQRKGLAFFLPFRYFQKPDQAWEKDKELEEISARMSGIFRSEEAGKRYLDICREVLCGV